LTDALGNRAQQADCFDQTWYDSATRTNRMH